MNESDIENSFLDVGQDKVAALGKRGTAGEQVGFFGIGVLSVFLVAEKVQVRTRKIGAADGIVLEISDLESDIISNRSSEIPFGTTIRIELKGDVNFSVENIPTIVQAYARHVASIATINSDTGQQFPNKDIWETADLAATSDVQGLSQLRGGRLGFVATLFRNEGALSNRLTLCNAGFLVEKQALDLMPVQTLGIAGELDLHPAQLSITMSREKFQRDAAWNRFGKDLLAWSASRALTELNSGLLRAAKTLDGDDVKRAILIWLNFIPQESPFRDLHSALESRLLTTVPFEVMERAPTSLEALIDSLPPARRLYFRRKGAATQRRQQSNDAGFPIQWHEEIRDSVRVAALRANGYQVINAQHIPVSLQHPNGVSNHNVDEVALIQRCLSRLNIQVLEITQAPDSDLNLETIERLPMLRSVVDIVGSLRFAAVADSDRRIVTDSSGVRYININHPEVKRLLKIIPAAISNPLKQDLLKAYFALEEFRVSEVRSILFRLLEDSHLTELAAAECAVLSAQVAQDKIKELLDSQ